MQLTLPEQYGLKRTQRGVLHSYAGEVELEIRSARTGALVRQLREHNIVKIFAKEILSHKLAHRKVWDPQAGGGGGEWVTHALDLDEYAPKYICFGASYDAKGFPLDTADSRFYSWDEVSRSYAPTLMDVGAKYDGGLINAIKIAEPVRPLKRVERIYFEPSYQPAGVPLLQDDVRAMNNVVVFETVLRKDEYNGFGMTDQDFFTITEVALVGAREVGAVGACECDPKDIFLDGQDGAPLTCTTSDTATISLDQNVSATSLNTIMEGDQIKILSVDSTKDAANTLGQVSPYYLVISKASGGRDMVLDRTPVTSSNIPLTGTVGVYRDGFRIFSHRILKSPVKKSADYEITVRWRIIMD